MCRRAATKRSASARSTSKSTPGRTAPGLLSKPATNRRGTAIATGQRGEAVNRVLIVRAVVGQDETINASIPGHVWREETALSSYPLFQVAKLRTAPSRTQETSGIPASIYGLMTDALISFGRHYAHDTLYPSAVKSARRAGRSRAFHDRHANDKPSRNHRTSVQRRICLADCHSRTGQYSALLHHSVCCP
jgi:hypothetical protein